MIEDASRLGFKRVVVAFDASPQGHALLELAGDLATCFGSSLAGVFLEDRRAGELAALPTAQEISIGSADLKNLDIEHVMAHQRAQLSLARRALDSIAAAHRLSSSFTVHDNPDDMALALADAEDLLMICSRLWPRPSHWAQDQLKHFLRGTAGGILALDAVRKRRRALPVAVLLGRKATADKDLLAVSRVLATHLAAPLELFAPRPLAALEELMEQAATAAPPSPADLPGPAVRLRPLQGGETFASRVALAGPAVVVLSSDESEEEVQGLLTAGLPLLLIRPLAAA